MLYSVNYPWILILQIITFWIVVQRLGNQRYTLFFKVLLTISIIMGMFGGISGVLNDERSIYGAFTGPFTVVFHLKYFFTPYIIFLYPYVLQVVITAVAISKQVKKRLSLRTALTLAVAQSFVAIGYGFLSLISAAG